MPPAEHKKSVYVGQYVILSTYYLLFLLEIIIQPQTLLISLLGGIKSTYQNITKYQIISALLWLSFKKIQSSMFLMQQHKKLIFSFFLHANRLWHKKVKLVNTFNFMQVFEKKGKKKLICSKLIKCNFFKQYLELPFIGIPTLGKLNVSFTGHKQLSEERKVYFLSSLQPLTAGVVKYVSRYHGCFFSLFYCFQIILTQSCNVRS